MANRNILLFDHKDTGWISFLSEYFEDTSSQLHFFYEPLKVGPFMENTKLDFVFLNAKMLTPTLLQRLKVFRQSQPEARLFHLGPVPKNSGTLEYDEIFLEPQTMFSFQKQLIPHFMLPEKIRVLVIDDEDEVGHMMRDYFESRTQPIFDVQFTHEGQKGLDILKKGQFDVVVLDIKMPSMDGREVYRQLKKQGIQTPVIIYFDAIFGDEMMEIHKYGRPAVVEKGSGASTMPEMVMLIKKLVYFG